MKCLVLLLILGFLLEADAYRNHWRWRKHKCAPVKCEIGCVEEIGPKHCPICKCEPVCLEKCEPGCEMKRLPGSTCPVCECNEEEKDTPVLDERKKPVCPELQCPLQCKIETVPDEPCPKCNCFDDVPSVIDDKKNHICVELQCPPKCKTETVPDEPCPKCNCLNEVASEIEEIPLCSPPICPPGCDLEEEFEGPCPGCKCLDELTKDAKGKKDACNEVQCGPECISTFDENGCRSCDCKPLCTPPICGPGCTLEVDFKGPCPGCICKEEVELEEKESDGEIAEGRSPKKCPPLEEECDKPGFMLKVDKNQCEICEPCEQPKCPRRCRIRFGQNVCGVCECSRFRYGLFARNLKGLK